MGKLRLSEVSLPKVTQQGEPGLGPQFPYSLLKALLKVLAARQLNSPENTLAHETTVIFPATAEPSIPEEPLLLEGTVCCHHPHAAEALGSCSCRALRPALEGLHRPLPCTPSPQRHGGGACWLVPWTSTQAFSTLPDLNAYRNLS